MTAAVRRLVLTARLRPGTRERALELAGSIPAQLGTSGFEQLGRHGVRGIARTV